MSSYSNSAESNQKGITRLFPVLAKVLDHPQTAVSLETMEIVMDVEQVSHLLGSWDDARHGRIVSMKDAFGDL
jgi:hypothetical protein